MHYCLGDVKVRRLSRVFHTTGTAGKLAAAAVVGRLLGLDAAAMNHCPGFGEHHGRGHACRHGPA